MFHDGFPDSTPNQYANRFPDGADKRAGRFANQRAHRKTDRFADGADKRADRFADRFADGAYGRTDATPYAVAHSPAGCLADRGTDGATLPLPTVLQGNQSCQQNRKYNRSRLIIFENSCPPAAVFENSCPPV